MIINVKSRITPLVITKSKRTTDIGVDLAGILGGRMARAEGGLVPSGVGYGEGCPLFSRLGGLGESRELPQQGPGQSPGQKRILAYFEGHRTVSYTHLTLPTILRV